MVVRIASLCKNNLKSLQLYMPHHMPKEPKAAFVDLTVRILSQIDYKPKRQQTSLEYIVLKHLITNNKSGDRLIKALVSSKVNALK